MWGRDPVVDDVSAGKGRRIDATDVFNGRSLRAKKELMPGASSVPVTGRDG